MNWQQVSPGIHVTDVNGFRITRIFEKKKDTKTVDEKGQSIFVDVYNYIAIKPGPPAPIRYAGGDINKILSSIYASQELALF